MTENGHNAAGEPLPLLDHVPARTRTSPAEDALPVPDREPALWYRLVTAIASCYVYVVGHTNMEPCRVELHPDGALACSVGGEVAWRLELPPAAVTLFDFVTQLWREGRFDESTQAEAVKLGPTIALPRGGYRVEVLPAAAYRGRPRTTVRRDGAG